MHKYKNKDISILIFTSGYWRSGFFRQLFSEWAFIKRINPVIEEINPCEIINFDIILWEREIETSLPEAIDEQKLFFFDYKDEGNRDLLEKTAKKWQIKKPRYLLLLPENKHNDCACLPLPLPKLKNNLFIKQKKLIKRANNLLFLCSPTYLFLDKNGNLPYTISYQGRICYNQRLEWAQILADAYMLPSGMGIVEPKAEYLHKENIHNLFKCNQNLFTDFVKKKDFINLILNTKIVFAPGGHSRWTYRHIEGMFYKGLVVSVDLFQHRMMPQLPLDAFISFPDGKFDVKVIQDILNDIDQFQDKANIGYDFAQRTYQPKSIFSKGGYSAEAAKRMFNDLISWFEGNKK